ncbi:cyclic nucleotide-binding domain-containing protein [Sessilibacter sp. MAH2]
MQNSLARDANQNEVERLLEFIPFFRQVKNKEPQQFHVLMAFSKVAQLSTGEEIFSMGSDDRWLFFLVRGELNVQLRDTNDRLLNLNSIHSGEVFGDLAMLLGRPRSASITVAPNCKQALVFGLDCNIFGYLNDFSLVTLHTKLVFYRNAVHSLRWKLEMYRNQHPDHSLAGEHRKLKIHHPQDGTLEELQSLHEQAVALATLLVTWNQSFCQFGNSALLKKPQ